MTNLFYLVLNNILDKVIVYVEQRFKTMGEFRFVELLNTKLYHFYKKTFPIEAFSNFQIELDRLKCQLKSVYATTSRPQEITEILWEFELNQALIKVNNLLCLILTIPATSAACERLFSSLKCVNNYVRCFQSEEWLSNLVFICTNKNFLKEMKVEHGADTFYNEVTDEFSKKKQIELIYK